MTTLDGRRIYRLLDSRHAAAKAMAEDHAQGFARYRTMQTASIRESRQLRDAGACPCFAVREARRHDGQMSFHLTQINDCLIRASDADLGDLVLVGDLVFQVAEVGHPAIYVGAEPQGDDGDDEGFPSLEDDLALAAVIYSEMVHFGRTL